MIPAPTGANMGVGPTGPKETVMAGTDLEGKAEFRFKRTMARDAFLKLAEQSPFTTFEEWPIEDVREACLARMRRYNLDDGVVEIGNHQAGWAEKCIIDLLKQRDNEMAAKVLEWYIYTDKAERAIKFALVDIRKNPALYNRIFPPITPDQLSKMIVGKLKKRAKPYDPHSHDDGRIDDGHIQEFMAELLNDLCLELHGASHNLDAIWPRAERALLLIKQAHDTALRSKVVTTLKYLIWSHKKRKKSAGQLPSFEYEKRLAVLEDVSRSLSRKAPPEA